RSSTSKARLRSPSSLAIAPGCPGPGAGRSKLDSSMQTSVPGTASITILVRESGMPQTVSRNSPSMPSWLPWTSRPSSTKNPVTAARSDTVTPIWSNLLIWGIGAWLMALPSPRGFRYFRRRLLRLMLRPRCGGSKQIRRLPDEKQAGIMSIEIFSADAERLNDIRQIFGTTGDPSWCKCQYFIDENWNQGADANDLARQTQVCTQQVPAGLVAYADGEPAGWVQVGPSTRYP